MNKKYFLIIALGLLSLRVSAFTDEEWIKPPYKVKVVKKLVTQSIRIVLYNLFNFKGDTFKISFSDDGEKAWVEGKSYTRATRNKHGFHYRQKFLLAIDLPAPVYQTFRGKSLKYRNKSPYFSYYNHNTDTALAIEIPIRYLFFPRQ